jgi:hyperosmotically inducible protein
MNRDELAGKAETFKGRIKQVAGDLTNNARLRNEGVIEEAKGRTQDAAGRIRRTVGEAMADVGQAAKKSRRGAAALAMMLTVGVGAVARAADMPDAWVTMKTKVSLMTTDGVSTSDLNVDTVNGVVTLHGKVATDAEKTKAGTVARGVDGAKDVKNMLQIVPKGLRKVVQRSDDAIKKSVTAAFKANRRVSASGIEVASVNKGVVLLSGKTTSLEAHLESVEVAHAVRGVRHVSSEVEMTPAS